MAAFLYLVEVAGAAALQELFVSTHGDAEGVHGLEAQPSGRGDQLGVVSEQTSYLRLQGDAVRGTAGRRRQDVSLCREPTRLRDRMPSTGRWKPIPRDFTTTRTWLRDSLMGTEEFLRDRRHSENTCDVAVRLPVQHVMHRPQVVAVEPLDSAHHQHRLLGVLQRPRPSQKQRLSRGTWRSAGSAAAYFLSPVDELQQGLPEGGPLAGLQPEAGVVGVADLRAAPVQVLVQQRVVSSAPVLQAAVDPLHQEEHHPAVGGVPDEHDLEQTGQSAGSADGAQRPAT